MTITTELTFADLIAQHQDELDDLRDAYEEAVQARADTDDAEERQALEQAAQAYNEAGKSIQQRIHALEGFRGDYDGGTFTVSMLSGRQLSDVETEMRMLAQSEGVDQSVLSAERQRMVVDKATVDAPDAVPTDEDGSPTPSECPNPLTLSLYEAVENLNRSGSADFRAPGFDDGPASEPSDTSVTPTPSEHSLMPSDTTDVSTPNSGENS